MLIKSLFVNLIAVVLQVRAYRSINMSVILTTDFCMTAHLRQVSNILSGKTFLGKMDYCVR